MKENKELPRHDKRGLGLVATLLFVFIIVFVPLIELLRYVNYFSDKENYLLTLALGTPPALVITRYVYAFVITILSTE